MTNPALSVETVNGQYTWLLFGDLRQGNTGVRVWHTGPDSSQDRASYQELVRAGREFELVNDANEVVFTGYIVGQYTGEEPLRDYGRQNGCTKIFYREN